MGVIFFSAAILCLLSEGSAGCSVDDGRVLKFSISHAKNSSGNWITSGSVEFESENEDAEIRYDVIRSVKICEDGKYLLTFFGQVPGGKGIGTWRTRSLMFHPRHGKNIKLTNGRKTASRIDETKDHGVVYTDRPLRSGEMLTVKLDKTTPKNLWNLGIGVTSFTPYDEDVPDQHLYLVTQKMWLYYHTHFYINGKRILEHYGVPMDDDRFFKMGDTVGLRITHSRVLHYFINGADQGPVANNISLDVYGVVELRSKTVQVTIVD